LAPSLYIYIHAPKYPGLDPICGSGSWEQVKIVLELA